MTPSTALLRPVEPVPPADYRIRPAYRFSDDERRQLESILDFDCNPYLDYPGFLERVLRIAEHHVPPYLRVLTDDLRSRNIWNEPVFLLNNCPMDDPVPVLGFDDPLNEKYRVKHRFVSEAFLQLFSALMGTTVVGYRTANNGDMFHDIHPMRDLAHTPSQKTVDTIKFHADIPNNRVRPDWVYLLSMRNDPVNDVYTVFVRLQDVFARLSAEVIEQLKRPIFFSPKDTVHVYGGAPDEATPLKPLLTTERGHTFLAYFEGNTRSSEPDGAAAIEALDGILHELGEPLFLYERDLVAVSNNTAMHARWVKEIRHEEAHRSRWLLKTWNADNLDDHRDHLMPGRIATADE